jgi:hypothetical protein
MKRQSDTKVCPTEKLPNPRSESAGAVTVPEASRLNTGTDPRVRLAKHSAQVPIRATLVGSKRCEALGLTGHGYAPVLTLCRALGAAGHDPRRPLHAYREDVLALKVRSIGEGAKLIVKEDRARPRFVKWEPFPRRVQARARQKAEGIGSAFDQADEPSVLPGAAVGTSAKSLPNSHSGTGRRR